jgi:hypothetical protein
LEDRAKLPIRLRPPPNRLGENAADVLNAEPHRLEAFTQLADLCLFWAKEQLAQLGKSGSSGVMPCCLRPMRRTLQGRVSHRTALPLAG